MAKRALEQADKEEKGEEGEEEERESEVREGEGREIEEREGEEREREERERRGYSGVRRKRYRKGADAQALFCRADKCGVDLSMARRYHRRYRVCEEHAKASVVLIGGAAQRFCQQCSRFHEVSQFDEAKRSCRNRLACHNKRRRKPTPEAQPMSTRPQKEIKCSGACKLHCKKAVVSSISRKKVK